MQRRALLPGTGSHSPVAIRQRLQGNLIRKTVCRQINQNNVIYETINSIQTCFSPILERKYDSESSYEIDLMVIAVLKKLNMLVSSHQEKKSMPESQYLLTLNCIKAAFDAITQKIHDCIQNKLPIIFGINLLSLINNCIKVTLGFCDKHCVNPYEIAKNISDEKIIEYYQSAFFCCKAIENASVTYLSDDDAYTAKRKGEFLECHLNIQCAHLEMIFVLQENKQLEKERIEILLDNFLNLIKKESSIAKKYIHQIRYFVNLAKFHILDNSLKKATDALLNARALSDKLVNDENPILPDLALLNITEALIHFLFKKNKYEESLFHLQILVEQVGDTVSHLEIMPRPPTLKDSYLLDQLDDYKKAQSALIEKYKNHYIFYFNVLIESNLKKSNIQIEEIEAYLLPNSMLLICSSDDFLLDAMEIIFIHNNIQHVRDKIECDNGVVKQCISFENIYELPPDFLKKIIARLPSVISDLKIKKSASENKSIETEKAKEIAQESSKSHISEKKPFLEKSSIFSSEPKNSSNKKFKLYLLENKDFYVEIHPKLKEYLKNNNKGAYKGALRNLKTLCKQGLVTGKVGRKGFIVIGYDIKGKDCSKDYRFLGHRAEDSDTYIIDQFNANHKNRNIISFREEPTSQLSIPFTKGKF